MYDISLADDMLRDLSYSYNIDYHGKTYFPESKDYYLTSDKLCICQGKCTSWCYVDKDCPNHKKGWSGKYKDCDSKHQYTRDEAEHMIRQTKNQIKQREEDTQRKREENRRKKNELRHQRETEKIKRLIKLENSIIKERQDKLLAKQDLSETKDVIKKFQQNLDQLQIPAKITMLLQKNRAFTFLGRYQTKNQYPQVIIKFLATEGINGHEAELQQETAKYDVAPGIYYNHENKILIMEYLSIEDGWIPHSEVYKFENVINKHLYHNQYELICKKINVLSKLGIEHGSLKADNIMFNYKDGNVRILDFESALKSTKEDINNKGSYSHNCTPKTLPIEYEEYSNSQGVKL